MVRGITTAFCHYCSARFVFKNKLLFDNYSSRSYFVLMNVRSLILPLYVLAVIWTMFYLSHPIMQTINSGALLLVVVFDYLFYGHKINRIGIAGVILGLTGVLIMANNRLIIKLIDPSFEFTTTFENYV